MTVAVLLYNYSTKSWHISGVNIVNNHHHYVPSVVNRSAVMDLHRSRSCATLVQSLYDIFVHSLMFSVHIVLGLPRPLLPFILPSISNRCIPSPLIHHHYVPSVVNRSAVMDLHRSRSCATLIQSLYDIFVHSLMLSVHIVLGLPRPLLPFILPSISNRCIPSPLIICPKY